MKPTYCKRRLARLGDRWQRGIMLLEAGLANFFRSGVRQLLTTPLHFSSEELSPGRVSKLNHVSSKRDRPMFYPVPGRDT